MKNRMNSSLPSIVVLIVTLSLCNAEDVWDGFVGKFTETYKPEDGFFPMPKTRAAAIKSNPPYSDIGFKDPDFDVQMYCLEKDPHICLLFDKNGELGGLRKSHLKSEVADDLAKFPYKYDKIPLFKSGNVLGEDIWYSDFLFTKPENLKQGGPGRTNTKETAEGIWVKLAEGWTEIPKDECDTAKEGWNHAFFYKWMGNHYAKNGTDLECESHLPLLAIYHYGHLIGLSSSPIGKHKNIARNWFEIVPTKIMKDGSCKKNLAMEYSTSGFHLYLIDDPRTVTELTPAGCDK